MIPAGWLHVLVFGHWLVALPTAGVDGSIGGINALEQLHRAARQRSDLGSDGTRPPRGMAFDLIPPLVFDLYTLVMTWDPTQYQRYSDERSRPFHELVDRIVVDPAAVATAVDLGCGPGHLTATLCDRWPNAQVIGVDNDANMLASAGALASDRLSFATGTVQSWRPHAPIDVAVSNATLQWVPGHLAMLPDLLSLVRPGGWFAFQVPGNLDAPHHQEIRALYRSTPWSDWPAVKALPDRTHGSHSATEYLDVLAPLCSHVDGWETTYIHIFHGDDPVLEWVKGTALRPVLAALQTDEARTEFLAQLAPRLRTAYPSSAWGTPFPFKRIFVVAQRAGSQRADWCDALIPK